MMSHTYNLTDITGRKAADRRTITFATIDWQRRTLMVLAWSLLPGAVVVAVLWPLMQEVALLFAAATVGVLMWLFLSKTRDAREVSKYRDMRDRLDSKKDVGRFYLAGREVDPMVNEPTVLHQEMASVTPPHQVARTGAWW